MFENFSLDSVIIAAVISAVITGVIIIYKEHKLEPTKWKKDARLALIEKRLQVYGNLISFLTSAKIRGDNWGTDSRHSLVHGKDTTEFQQIFRKYYHLFSPKLNNEYLKAVKADKHFRLGSKPKEEPHISSNDISFDLSSMHELSEKDYSSILTEYEKMTGYSIK